jgi:hypothetical protein
MAGCGTSQTSRVGTAGSGCAGGGVSANPDRVGARGAGTGTHTGSGAEGAWSGGISCPTGQRAAVLYARGELPYWVAKAAREVERGSAAVVLVLMPARTDTRYWHMYVAGRASIFFLRGRLRFDEEGTPAPFPSALVVWGSRPEIVAAMREALPEAWHVGQS